MSYVIQNFSKINPTFRLTYRKYFYWLLRNNYKIILNFFYANNLEYSLGFNRNLFNVFRSFFYKSAFTNSLRFYFSSRSILWKPFLENSLIRSFEYWSFSNLLNITSLDKPIINLNFKPLSATYFNNQNILEKKYSKMSLYNKTYRIAFNKFTLLLLSSWKIWRPAYNLVINVNLVNMDWLILKRFNTTFFKVFFI